MTLPDDLRDKLELMEECYGVHSDAPDTIIIRDTVIATGANIDGNPHSKKSGEVVEVTEKVIEL